MDFYTGLMLVLSGFAMGFTASCLLTFVGLRRGWIRIREAEEEESFDARLLRFEMEADKIVRRPSILEPFLRALRIHEQVREARARRKQ